MVYGDFSDWRRRKTKPIYGFRPEIRNELNGCYLKKQSQFAESQNDVNVYMKGDYGGFYALRLRKNKAKQSQYYRSEFVVQSSASKQGKGIWKNKANFGMLL